MKKLIRSFLAVTVLMQLSGAALADEPVRTNSDGKVIDADGNVTAVQNTEDSRNTDYKKYYMNIDPATGRSTGTSSFYIISDPDRGYVKKEITTTTTATTTQPTTSQPVDFTPFKLTAAGVTTPATTTTATQTTPVDTHIIRNGRYTTVYHTGGQKAVASNPTNSNNPVATTNNSPVAKPALVDAPVRASPSDAVYGNVTNTETLYGQ